MPHQPSYVEAREFVPTRQQIPLATNNSGSPQVVEQRIVTLRHDVFQTGIAEPPVDAAPSAPRVVDPRQYNNLESVGLQPMRQIPEVAVAAGAVFAEMAVINAGMQQDTRAVAGAAERIVELRRPQARHDDLFDCVRQISCPAPDQAFRQRRFGLTVQPRHIGVVDDVAATVEQCGAVTENKDVGMLGDQVEGQLQIAYLVKKRREMCVAFRQAAAPPDQGGLRFARLIEPVEKRLAQLCCNRLQARADRQSRILGAKSTLPALGYAEIALQADPGRLGRYPAPDDFVPNIVAGETD